MMRCAKKLLMVCGSDSWFHAALERIGPAIPVPPLKGDPLRCSTVLPYLESYHYQADRDADDVYFTEHDLNRECEHIRQS